MRALACVCILFNLKQFLLNPLLKLGLIAMGLALWHEARLLIRNHILALAHIFQSVYTCLYAQH